LFYITERSVSIKRLSKEFIMARGRVEKAIASTAENPDTAGENADGKSRHSIGARRNPEAEQAILDAAESILKEKGLGGFSIEAVARRARAGKPTIYRWWPNRTSLLLAVYQRQKGAFDTFDSGDVETDARDFLEHLLAYWREGAAGQVFRSVIAEAQTDPDAAEVLEAYSHERHQLTADIFRRGIARGELRTDIDPVIAAETLASFARGRLLIGKLDTSRAELAQAARQIVAGLKA